MESLSYAWRGPRGSGKRTQLLSFLEKRAKQFQLPFEVKEGTWFLAKQNTPGDPEDDDDGPTGKTIPYEYSVLHLGFDVARMSMSDKVFIQSILTRWTGQQDVTLSHTNYRARYLVLYHSQYVTDESTMQLQEALEQFSNFAILLTTELPVCPRLRDYCVEISTQGEDRLLASYVKRVGLPERDAWNAFFTKTLDDWSLSWSQARIYDVRSWVYMCLQRNLRWSDVIMYWLEVIYQAEWVKVEHRKELMKILWKAESGAGWTLVTSYRIPILWEHVHLHLAKMLYTFRMQYQENDRSASSGINCIDDPPGVCTAIA
jgi:hypothetical protein